MQQIGLFEAINTLRAVRRYQQRPVEEEKLRIVLEAAIKAPNGSMMDPWHFVVVRDQETKKRLTPLYAKAARMYSNERYELTDEVKSRQEKTRYFVEHLDEVPLMVFMFMDPYKRVVKIGFLNDLVEVTMYGTVFPAIQNMLLTARALGLGSVLTTLLNLFEEDVKTILGTPKHVKLVAMVVLGYPAVKFGTPCRKPLDLFLHWERW